MEFCKVNFVHNQMYKVHNHFQNGRKQIGYVETDKLYYIARNYNISLTLLDAILNKNVDEINLVVKRTYGLTGEFYLEGQYKVEYVVPRILADGNVSYFIFVKDVDEKEKDALYVSDNYFWLSSDESDAHIEKIADKCLVDVGDRIKTQIGMQRYINKEIDKTSEEFKQYIEQRVNEQEAKKCEETK